ERLAIHGAYGLASSLQGALKKFRVPMSRADVEAGLAGAETLAALFGRLACAMRLPSEAFDLHAPGPSLNVVVPIDQGEELFLSDGRAEAQTLLNLLGAVDMRLRDAVETTAGPIRLRLLVVLTIRSDSMEAVQLEPALRQLCPVLFSLAPMPVT